MKPNPFAPITPMTWTAVTLIATALLAVVAVADSTPKPFGAAITLREPVSIARLLQDPKAFEGKLVRVEGSVQDVCPRAGCWMDLASPEGTVKVKVDDGVIVFPVTAKGHAAVAEGKVEVMELSREAYVRWVEHLAEEKGQAFDPKSVGEGPYRLVQIKATGAEIQGL